MNVLPTQGLREKEARIKDGLTKAFVRGGETGGMRELARVMRDTERPDEALDRMRRNGVEFEKISGPEEYRKRGGKVFSGWSPPPKPTA